MKEFIKLKVTESELSVILSALMCEEKRQLDIWNDRENATIARSQANHEAKMLNKLTNELMAQQNSRLQP